MPEPERNISRRELLRTVALAAVATPLGRDRPGSVPSTTRRSGMRHDSDQAGIRQRVGTTGLDSLSMQVVDYQKEAAFFQALMGWTLRSDDGKRRDGHRRLGHDDHSRRSAVAAPLAPAGDRRRWAGGRAPARAVVDSFSWGITPWDARRSKLSCGAAAPQSPITAGTVSKLPYEGSGRVRLQIGNGRNDRRSRSRHRSRSRSRPRDGRRSGSITSRSRSPTKRERFVLLNLLGWGPTYDEGSQNELMIGDVGDIIIRGGNPLDPQRFGADGRRGGRGSAARGPHRSHLVRHLSRGTPTR